MLDLIYQTLLNNFVVQFCVVAILLFFCIALWSELSLTRRFNARLRQWSELLDELKTKSVSDDYKYIDLIQRYFVITGWSNGRAELAATGDKENDKLLVNVPPIYCLPERPASPNRFYPALLTSIGVLGTFSGITLGLSSFETSGDASAMMDSATGLLDGMRSAFATSLFGLFFGAVFMIILSVTDRIRKARFDTVLAHLSARALPMSSTTLLYGMYETQYDISQRQLAAAKTMADSAREMSSALGELQWALTAFSQKDIGADLAAALDAGRSTAQNITGDYLDDADHTGVYPETDTFPKGDV